MSSESASHQTNSFSDCKTNSRRCYNGFAHMYNDICGKHIHHGYWITGDETKEDAQLQMIQELARRAGIKPGARVLDIGCGLGGTAVYLVEHFGVTVDGITVSRNELEIANEKVREMGFERQVMLTEMDAEQLEFPEETFDDVWCCEVLCHLLDRSRFFEAVHNVMKDRGRLTLLVWIKANDISPEDEKEYISPITEGIMIPPLSSLNEYLQLLKDNNFVIKSCEDVGEKVSKTWQTSRSDHSKSTGFVITKMLSYLVRPSIWKLIWDVGLSDFKKFLNSSSQMQKGFETKTFSCAIIVAEKT